MKKEERRGKGSPRARLGAFFVLFLFGFGILNFFHKDRSFSETENRMLEQKPVWQAASVLDGRLMSSFQRYRTGSGLYSGTDLFRFGRRQTGCGEAGSREACFWEEKERSMKSRRSFRSIHGKISTLFPLLHFVIRSFRCICCLRLTRRESARKVFRPLLPVENQREQLEEISRYLNGAVKEIPVFHDALREHREEYMPIRTRSSLDDAGRLVCLMKKRRRLSSLDAGTRESRRFIRLRTALRGRWRPGAVIVFLPTRYRFSGSRSRQSLW